MVARHRCDGSTRITQMGDDTLESAAARRAARAHWPIARFVLGQEPPDDLSEVTTPAERLAMMWFLAESAWKVAGGPWPTYDRGAMPARLFRAGAPRPADDVD